MEVVEDSSVSPPPRSVPTTSVPLSFLDIFWLSCRPMQRLFFYQLPHPASYLKRTIVPNLKHSLSLALQHFFPLAGNLIFPPRPNKPYICYKQGNSLRFTVFETTWDFNHLAGNHPRGVGEIQGLVPKLPRGTIHQPVMEIQVTLFPGSGISIGVTFLHVVMDGKAFSHFMSSWAAIHKSGGNLMISPPYHNRDVFKDPSDIGCTFIKAGCSWEEFVSIRSEDIRVTFVLTRAQIEKLKTRVTTMNTGDEESLHVSTFAVACAYVWVCVTKLEHEQACNDDDEDNDNDDGTLCHFIFPADCRDRLEFPVPATYFGNCIAMCFAAAKKRELLGKDGILAAVKALGREITGLKQGPLQEVDKWLSKVEEIAKPGKNYLTVAGSPKFGVYETDFGWGRPNKTEVAHIFTKGCFSIGECRDEDGGVELGFALWPSELDAFTAVFVLGLN